MLIQSVETLHGIPKRKRMVKTKSSQQRIRPW
nr:MAG TPA: hypothetical protein [Caudoviricetes sp.]